MPAVISQGGAQREDRYLREHYPMAGLLGCVSQSLVSAGGAGVSATEASFLR